MNENATIDMERDQNDGQITYANDVIATIVSVATAEVDGISGIAGVARSGEGLAAPVPGKEPVAGRSACAHAGQRRQDLSTT